MQKTFKSYIGDLDAKKKKRKKKKKIFKHHIGEPRTRELMNTQNEEDIPTRNFKKKKKNNKNILNWRQTTFHVEQKQNKKKKGTKKTPQKTTTTTTASETQRKIFKCSHRTNFWKTKLDVNTKARGISLSKTLSFNTFSLPNLQNKVTFLNFHSPYFYFGSCRHMVYLSHYLTKPPITTRNFRGPPQKILTLLLYATFSAHNLFFPKVTYLKKKKKKKKKKRTTRYTKKRKISSKY